MIGIFAAAAGGMDRETIGRDEVGGIGTGSGRIERRVLDQPDKLIGLATRNPLDLGFHPRDRLRIGDEIRRDPPAHRRMAGRGEKAAVEAVALHGIEGSVAILP